MSKGITLSFAVLLVCLLAPAAQAQDIDLGKREYQQNCASCHGIDGKGDGPISGYLTTKPSDLSTIMQRNNGVFPMSLIVETIDGRRMIAVHGTKDMPAWGNEYDEKAAAYYRDYFDPYNPETFITARILALAEYIYELQD